MDILRELSDEELDFVIEKLKRHLPYAIKDLLYILSAQKCKSSGIEDLSDKVLPTFYTHRNGDKENCTIFGITGARNHTVWYFSFDDTLKEIRECIEQTKRIKWGEQFLFVTIHVEQIKPLLDYAHRNGYEIEDNEANSYYYLPIEEALKVTIE
jgi:hypothetical protein